MSLLLMSIGVIMLATLFPIAQLRTARATQLTRGTILRYNAESEIRARDLTNDSEMPVGPPVYMIDPLGWHEDSVSPNFFGTGAAAGVPRVRNANFNTAANNTQHQNAIRLVTLPDSWVDLAAVEGPLTSGAMAGPPAAGPNTVSFRTDLSDLTSMNNNQIPIRVIVISEDGRSSAVRQVNFNAMSATDLPNGVLELTQPSLPATGYDRPLIARVEYQEQQFTWMATVRKDLSGNTRGEIVVFFRREYNPNYEVFHRVEGPTNTTTALAGDGARGRPIRITFNADPAVYGESSYLFDADNGLWYQIQTFAAITGDGTQAGDEIDVVLKSPLISPTANMVLIPRIVAVFPIASFAN